MPEKGGPTTQSGILYQNSVAALYLGRLCDAAWRPDDQSIVHVRVEAPKQVDDIVITFADGHRVYIQAKESLISSADAWRELWRDFDNQFRNKEFRRGSDRLLLQVGNWRDEHNDLRELCQRAGTSENYEEWQGRQSKKQMIVVEKVKPNLSPELLEEKYLLDFLGHVDVKIQPLLQIERDLVIQWIPQSTRSVHEVFRLLRDRVGGRARVRGSFTAHELRRSFKVESPDLEFSAPPDLDSLRISIKNCGSLLRQHKHTIANTGYHVKRALVDDISKWIQEDSNDSKNLAMLIDQAGMGKTVIMRDLLCELESEGVDVLAIKADQQLSDVASFAEIQERLNFPSSVEQAIRRLAKLGRVAVLIDQIDALSLSLAHDQRTLNAVLDLVARLCCIPNTRIVLSCRLFDRNSDPQLRQIDLARQFTPGQFSQEETREALVRVNVKLESLSESTQELLHTPLHLDLLALAVENDIESTTNLQGIASLQELYGLIWQNVALKQAPDAPPRSDREEVLSLFTDYMDREQGVSVPHTLLQASDSARLEQAVNWLASVGIIIQGKTGWTFLHQTFFDYCYARRFVDRGDDIVKAVLNSEQGLLERRKLIQVISYLRGSNPNRYLQGLQRLLDASDMRHHLNDLFLRWFGALPDPTDDEWILAHRILLDPAKQSRFLATMSGNIGWFSRLRDTVLPEWLLSKRDVDSLAIPYLASMVDVAQAQVTGLVRPYLGRSADWDNRITSLISKIRNWYTTDAIELYEQCVYKQLIPPSSLDLFQLGVVAKVHPQTGCRLIRFVFDRILDQYLGKREQESEELGEASAFSIPRTTLYMELSSLDNHQIEEALRSVSKAEPLLFIEIMIPWLEKALSSRVAPNDERLDHYMWDELSGSWYEDVFRVRAAFIHSLIAALIEMARSEPASFRQIAVMLAELPYETPQQLLTYVYRAEPESYADDACAFLLADQRRLDLGDHEQYDSRQLIRSLYPYLIDEQRARLEAHILAYAPIRRYLGVDGLRWRGLEQLYLLQSIPEEYLSPTGISRLREWERKFPDRRASEKPITSEGGLVGSPISEDIARKMSDKNWLRAMQKYQGAVEHRDILKGGARQFSGLLANLIKEDPDRFYRLVHQAPDDVDDAYVTAFMDGLAESDASTDWLFDVVRRFAPQDGRDIKRAIAWAINKRIDGGIPEDLVDLLDSYVRESPGEDEWWWSTGENRGDAYNSYLNSDRGSAFRVLMRFFNHSGDDALRHKWSLIEFAAADSSTSLRVGAIHELTYMIRHDRERAILLFEQLIDGHEVLLESQYVREFLYWAFNKNFLRLQPYIVSMMNQELDHVQEQGAQLACIAALSTGAMESTEAQRAAQDLAEQAITGPPAWRRGAARIYSHNITGSSMDVSIQKVISLLGDEDEQVGNHISNIFFSLRSEHFFTLRGFIEAYANSARKFEHQFAKYLWEHGLLEPAWTLSIVRAILGGAAYRQGHRWWLPGIEELIRLVLRIYTDPTADGGLRNEAMDAFDILMERYSKHAQKVLQEWDRS